jgi:hypothetical protein
MEQTHPDSELIDALGGNAEVMKLCKNKISSPAISKWRFRGIPAGYRMYLEGARPDVFDCKIKE